MSKPASALKLGLLGYGEVGTILGRELREKGVGWVAPGMCSSAIRARLRL